MVLLVLLNVLMVLLDLMVFLGPSSLPVVVAQPDERHANRTASVLELGVV